jgi:hypothetical protein
MPAAAAESHCARLLEEFAGERFVEATVGATRAYLVALQGRDDEARSALARAWDLARSSFEPYAIPYIAYAAGQVELRLGDPAFAVLPCESNSPSATLGVAIRGHLDHAGGRGWGLAARHWPQFRQIVVPIAGSVVGHRIDDILPHPSADQAACSVSCAQPEQ